MAYRFRVTVESLDGTGGAPLVFEVANHDHIPAIVERIRTKVALEGDAVASLGVGMKLLGSVALAQRNDPLFDGVRPALHELTMKLKQMPALEARQGTGRLL